MESPSFSLIVVLVFAGVFALSTLASPISDITRETTTEEGRKVLQDCQHTDYRTYIKCLKRQKRQHFQHGDGHSEIDDHCMDTCLKKCEPEHHDCEKKCNYCTKRAKHKHQIITEYETDCVSGNCDDKNGLGAPNITTNIDINNVINNYDVNSTHCCPNCKPPILCFPPHLPINPTSRIWPPNVSQFPPLTLVPQITFGLGFGPIGGCQYPNQWPCVPPYTPGTTDCSGCGNPFMGFKCDISCYPVQGTKSTNSGTPCISPYCVGGTQK